MRFAYLIEPPFNFRDPDGAVAGADVDVARHVLAALGHGFEPVETEFAALLPGLGAGRWRMTTGMFATPERAALACFSRPVWALPDGLLVAAGNPLRLDGYRAVAARGAVLAVVRDQVQQRSAAAAGVAAERFRVFETYGDAAAAVAGGAADAFASVARAHAGFVAQGAGGFEVVPVPVAEKPPAFGAFAFARDDTGLRDAVDGVLAGFLGSPAHRRMVAGYGFTEAEVDLVAGR